jgi:undecaprenyl-diphosphatase
MRREGHGRASLPLGHAVALGALHGPAELLPISSSAHVALVPVLLGWPAAALPGDVRKAFAVALHAGTLPPLLVLVPRPPLRLALPAVAPAAVAGLLFEGPIEERLSGPAATAIGLLAGSAALVLADALGPRDRRAGDATSRDALVLGAAQALALVPGVSRLGLTIAAARALGFDRASAFALARSAGLPVVAAATALKSRRLLRGGLPRELRGPFAAGAGAALVTTAAAAPLRRVTAVGPLAAERAVLAGLALRAVRRRRAG